MLLHGCDDGGDVCDGDGGDDDGNAWPFGPVELVWLRQSARPWPRVRGGDGDAHDDYDGDDDDADAGVADYVAGCIAASRRPDLTCSPTSSPDWSHPAKVGAVGYR